MYVLIVKNRIECLPSILLYYILAIIHIVLLLIYAYWLYHALRLPLFDTIMQLLESKSTQLAIHVDALLYLFNGMDDNGSRRGKKLPWRC